MSELEDRRAIEDVLVRYTRGVDRIDIPMIKSVYWPEAIDDHGTFTGNAHEYADYLDEILRTFAATTHSLSNIHVELDGDRARCETCVRATHVQNRPEGQVIFTLGGRYLDRMEKRGGEWRIAGRHLVVDWLEVPPEAADLRPLLDKMKSKGRPYPDDPWHKGEPILPGAAAAPPSPLEVVRVMHAAVGARDWEALAALCDESLEVREAPSMPYGGVYRGPKGFVDLVQKLLDTWEITIDPNDASRRLDALGDTVCSRSFLKATSRATGRRYEAPHVEFLTVKGGKITALDVFYWDTAAVAAACRP